VRYCWIAQLSANPTLFNALTQDKRRRQAANYPLLPIEPNVGDVAVPDVRLDKLAVIGKSAEIIPTRITFVDNRGPGCAAHRKAKAWATSSSPISARSMPSCMCLRCFEDDDITHVETRSTRAAMPRRWKPS